MPGGNAQKDSRSLPPRQLKKEQRENLDRGHFDDRFEAAATPELDSLVLFGTGLLGGGGLRDLRERCSRCRG